MLNTVYAETDAQLKAVRELFLEYASSLDFDLGFQNFDQELASLPGEYVPPRGRLILAKTETGFAGCVALRPIDGNICEMKRLYVRPEARRLGVGRLLGETIVREARQAGYNRMRLDTVAWMTEARGLYHSLGFVPIAAYRYNPIEGAEYLELKLMDGPTPSHCAEGSNS